MSPAKRTPRLFLRALLLLLLVATPVLAQVPVQMQEVPLNTGWNLISVQVAPGGGYTPAQIQSSIVTAAGTPVASLLSAWNFNAPAANWLSFQATNANYPHDLTTVLPGSGYWIQVNQACFLRLTNSPWQGAVQIRPGWNLVSFPGLRVDSAGLALEAVFRDKFSYVQQVWTYDSSPARRRYVGYDTTARPPLKELNSVEPGKAYWVYSTATAVLDLTNAPAITLPPDIDNPPLQIAEAFVPNDARFKGTTTTTYSGLSVRYVGSEDAGNDLNGNGILDDAFTQDTLFFPEGINTRLVTILNQGYGRLDWHALAAAPSYGAFVSFATASPAVDAAGIAPDLVSAQAGRTVNSTTNIAFGSVASAPGHLTVQVDRTGLLPGRYTNTIAISAGNTTKLVKAVLVVPSIDGDWRGFAATRSVNGKAIPIGKVDLHLAVFRRAGSTNANEPNIRAVISRDRSLLFPRDVAMSGSFYSDHEFFLTSNFEVQRGDRNAPPFTKFQTGADDQTGGKGFGDFDGNNDGKLDNSNPFPYALRREISLLGVRLTENRLTGSYIESIQNILPGTQKIYIEGEFELERLTLTPTLTSVFNSSLSTNAIIGGGGSSSFSTTFNVTNAFSVEGVSGSFNLDFGGGRDVEVRLVAPDGTNSVLLLPKATGLSGSHTYSLTNFNGFVGTGLWKLIVTWGGGSERGNFYNWDLRLQGTAAYNVAGLVATVTSGVTNPLPGAVVMLTGNGAVAQFTTGPDGRFSFTNLTENDFNLLLSKPGYASLQTDFELFASSKDLGTVVLTPLTTPASTLLAAPFVGGQPLNVAFTPLLSATDATSVGAITNLSWAFGNGETLNVTTNTLLPASFVYTNPGYFASVLTVNGSTGQLKLTNYVHVLRQDPTNTAFNLLSVGFIGGGAPGGEGVTSTTTNVSLTIGGVAVTNSMKTAVNLRECIRDVAAFDFNRNSAGFNSITDADTDVFQTSQNGSGTNGVFYLVDGSGGGDNTYTVNTNALRYRMICTMGGSVFATAPARVGYQSLANPNVLTNYVLQVGRIEP